MTKNLIFDLILASFGPNLVPKILFRGFYLYLVLHIFASYHCMQFKEN